MLRTQKVSQLFLGIICGKLKRTCQHTQDAALFSFPLAVGYLSQSNARARHFVACHAAHRASARFL
jgi:hypothetical protein